MSIRKPIKTNCLRCFAPLLVNCVFLTSATLLTDCVFFGVESVSPAEVAQTSLWSLDVRAQPGTATQIKLGATRAEVIAGLGEPLASSREGPLPIDTYPAQHPVRWSAWA